MFASLPRTAPLALLLLALAGCGPGPNARDALRAKGGGGQDEGISFNQALGLLEHSDEYGGSLVHHRALLHLNDWIHLQPEFAWTREPMLADLPPDLAPWAAAANLDALAFQPADTPYLLEMIWLRNLSRWAADRPPALAGMQAWLAEVKKEKGEETAANLAVAERLFDWTVRNIQLEPLVAAGGAAIVGPLGPDLDPKKKRAGPAKAELLPGARLFPGEAIVYGQGDALVRARVFIHLLRQRQIDAVVLALSSSKSPAPLPWAVAAILGGELYLFDPAVGLPVLGPGRRGIATWAQVRKDPSLLAQMNASDTDKYPIEAADLGGTIAWIDADPLALSKRMKMVEAKLTGEQRTALTTDPSRLKSQLLKVPGMVDVRLWAAPFHAYIYKRRLERDPQALNDAEMYARMYGLMAHLITRFDEIDPHKLVEHGEANQLYLARVKHFRADFQRGDGPGAKQCYLECRKVQLIIDMLQTAHLKELPQAKAILARDPTFLDKPEQRKAFVDSMTAVFTNLKVQATYWMGVAAYDTGQFEVAASHFSKRLLDEQEKSALAAATRYNLARSYEALGKLDLARDTLFLEEGAQKYGNELRARVLPEK